MGPKAAYVQYLYGSQVSPVWSRGDDLVGGRPLDEALLSTDTQILMF